MKRWGGILWLALVSQLRVPAVMAQDAPPSGGEYQLRLSPPNSATPLSEAQIRDNIRVFARLFEEMDANHDGTLSQEELAVWFRGLGATNVTVQVQPGWGNSGAGGLQAEGTMQWTTGTWSGTGVVAPGGTEGGGALMVTGGSAAFQPVAGGSVTFQPGIVFHAGTWGIAPGQADPSNSPAEAPPECPECSAELVQLEQGTFFPTVCGTNEGNLQIRTLCQVSGFESRPIFIPENNEAGCFRIEAQVGGQVAFTLFAENDPHNIIYDSQRDGLDHLGEVHLSATGLYRVALSPTAVAGARVSLSFVTYPETGAGGDGGP